METSWFPSFTTDAKRELKKLGVTTAQLVELNVALVRVRAMLVPPAAKNETAELLTDIRKLTKKLSGKLRELGTTSNSAGQNSARQKVANLLAQGYWNLRQKDGGPTIICAFCPRLDALELAAKDALNAPKGKPSRYKAASPEPVRIIDEALLSGWHKQHGALAVWGNKTEIRAATNRRLRVKKPAPAYPRNLQPSTSPTSRFWKIVGICYAAIGKNNYPERAIKAYVTAEKKRRRQALLTFDACLASAQHRTERRQKS